jgi:hypothetical protein
MKAAMAAIAAAALALGASAQEALRPASGERGAYNYIGRNRTVIPHLAYGGYWHTKITLVNLSGYPLTVSIYFYNDAATAVAVPIRNYGALTFVEVYVPAFATRTIETNEQPGDPLKVGWARGTIQCPSGGCDQVLMYGTFGTVNVAGRPDFEATLFAADSRGVMGSLAFDNQRGFSTGVAVAAYDCTGANPDVRINFKYDDTPGSTFYQYVVPMSCPGHTQFSLPDFNPVSQGRAGYVQVFSNQAKVYVIGLLFNPNGGAFTTLPVVEYLP